MKAKTLLLPSWTLLFNISKFYYTQSTILDEFVFPPQGIYCNGFPMNACITCVEEQVFIIITKLVFATHYRARHYNHGLTILAYTGAGNGCKTAKPSSRLVKNAFWDLKLPAVVAPAIS